MITGTSSAATPSTFAARDNAGGLAGSALTVAASSPAPPVPTTLSKDNLINAWGNIPASGATATAKFGITSYTHTNNSGVYVFTLDNALSNANGSVSVTLQSAGFGTAVISSQNTITVTTISTTSAATDIAFFVQVIQGNRAL